MNIVEQVARMIDCEGAYSEASPNTSRQKFYRAKYEHLAVQIVSLLNEASPRQIKADLIDFEKAGWRKLGVPIDDPRLQQAADEIIRAKYTSPVAT